MKLVTRHPLISAALLGVTLGVGYMLIVTAILSP